MNFYRRLSNIEAAGDRLIGIAPAETTQNGPLPIGQLKFSGIGLERRALNTGGFFAVLSRRCRLIKWEA